MYIETIIGVKGFEDYLVTSDENKMDFGKINIFVGPNNSGKSRCMRQMFREFTKKEQPNHQLQGTLNIRGPLITLRDSLALTDYVDGNMVRISKLLKLDEADKLLRENSEVSSLEALKKNGIIDLIRGLKNTQIEGMENSRAHESFRIAVEAAIKHIVKQYDRAFIDARYIPVNRTLKPLQYAIDEHDREKKIWNYKDVVKDRTVAEYFANTIDSKFTEKIFTGQGIYDSLVMNLLGKKDKRKLISDYQAILSEMFFDGASVTLIPNKDSGTVAVQIEEKEYEIFNWGEGMQSLLAITYEMFLNKDKDIVFYIEEPEINMHPAMQRQLINLMTHKDLSRLQIFMTTHSNHFLDVFLEHEGVQFFKFSPAGKQFSIKCTNQADLECLSDLGVRNSSVLLSNCVIWVEGSTDVAYYRKILEEIMETEKLGPRFIEDYHYTFCYTGGDCIVDYGFCEVKRDAGQVNVRALGNKVLVIKDNSMGEASKAKIYEDLDKALGDSFIELPVREVENLVSEDILEEILKDYYKRVFKKTMSFKGKINIEEYKRADYSEYLASIYNAEVNESSKHERIIKEKKDFARLVIDKSQSLVKSAFSKEAHEIGMRILEFIKNSN